FPLTLTQAGRETSFLELDADTAKSAERWAQMPPHYWGVVGRAKPGATPLAWVEEGGAAKKAGPERERESALIARHNYGFGRVLRLDGPKEQAVALVTLARRPGQPRVLTGTLRDLPPGQYGVELVIPDLTDKLLTPDAPPSERAGKPLRASFTLLPPDSRESV